MIKIFDASRFYGFFALLRLPFYILFYILYFTSINDRNRLSYNQKKKYMILKSTVEL